MIAAKPSTASSTADDQPAPATAGTAPRAAAGGRPRRRVGRRALGRRLRSAPRSGSVRARASSQAWKTCRRICGDVGEDPDAEHDDDAGRQLAADAELVAEVDDRGGDHDVGDERDDEHLVVEDARRGRRAARRRPRRARRPPRSAGRGRGRPGTSGVKISPSTTPTRSPSAAIMARCPPGVRVCRCRRSGQPAPTAARWPGRPAATWCRRCARRTGTRGCPSARTTAPPIELESRLAGRVSGFADHVEDVRRVDRLGVHAGSPMPDVAERAEHREPLAVDADRLGAGRPQRVGRAGRGRSRARARCASLPGALFDGDLHARAA